MRHIALAAIAVLGLGAQTALAADLPARPVYKAPIMAPAFSWTGFYAGIHAGYGWSDLRGTYDGADAAGPTNLGNLNGDGFVIGGHLGYNYQFSNIVIGIEADASWNDAEDTIRSPEPPPRGPDPVKYDRDYLASVRGRLGFAFDRTLFYGTGGVAWTTHKLTITETLTGQTGTIKRSQTGFVVGGGIEHAFGDGSWTARVEYLHYELDRRVALNAGTFNDADAGDFIRFPNVDVVRFGIQKRF